MSGLNCKLGFSSRKEFMSSLVRGRQYKIHFAFLYQVNSIDQSCSMKIRSFQENNAAIWHWNKYNRADTIAQDTNVSYITTRKVNQIEDQDFDLWVWCIHCSTRLHISHDLENLEDRLFGPSEGNRGRPWKW